MIQLCIKGLDIKLDSIVQLLPVLSSTASNDQCITGCDLAGNSLLAQSPAEAARIFTRQVPDEGSLDSNCNGLGIVRIVIFWLQCGQALNIRALRSVTSGGCCNSFLVVGLPNHFEFEVAQRWPMVCGGGRLRGCCFCFCWSSFTRSRLLQHSALDDDPCDSREEQQYEPGCAHGDSGA